VLNDENSDLLNTGRKGEESDGVFNKNNNNNNRETSYLFQRISVLIQRFNATLLHESFADENHSDD